MRVSLVSKTLLTIAMVVAFVAQCAPVSALATDRVPAYQSFTTYELGDIPDDVPAFYTPRLGGLFCLPEPAAVSGLFICERAEVLLYGV